MDEEGRNEMTFLEWIHGCFLQEGVDCAEPAIQHCRANRMSVSSHEWIRRLFEQNDCVHVGNPKVSCEIDHGITIQGYFSSCRYDAGTACNGQEETVQIWTNQMGSMVVEQIR
jgi:hypothetical protein